MKTIEIIYIIVQILAVVLFVGSVQLKKKKNILLCQTFASFCYAGAYLINGGYSGMCTELLEQCKNFSFWCFERKDKKIPFLFLVFFLVLLMGCAVITYNGIASLLPYLINIVYFVSSYFKNPKYIRLSVFICGFIWLMYNISTGAYIICLGNAFEIISGGISLLRFRNEGNKKKRNSRKKVQVH